MQRKYKAKKLYGLVIKKKFLIDQNCGSGRKTWKVTYGLSKIADLEKKIEKVTYGLAKITDFREKFEKNTYRLGIKDFEILEKNIRIGD